MTRHPGWNWKLPSEAEKLRAAIKAAKKADKDARRKKYEEKKAKKKKGNDATDINWPESRRHFV